MAAELPATFTPAEAEERGVPRHRLWELQREGSVERIARGLYRRTDAELADTDLLEIAIKSTSGTLCLLSALARHDLTDAIPPVHDIAIPRGAWQPVIRAPVRWHHFDRASFDVGRQEIPIDSVTSIGLYDAPRSIVDSFRLRHEVGTEVGNEALRRWLRRGGKPAVLLDRASAFPRSRSAVLHAMQILL